MHLWNWPISAPVLLGYYRLVESISLTLDFMLFEIVMCGILYMVTRGILLMKVLKLEKANEEAHKFFSHLSQEPNSSVQNKCLRRCLSISDAALREYDSLLMYIGKIQHQPTRKVCLQRLPQDIELLKKISFDESFQCLRNTLSDNNVSEMRHPFRRSLRDWPSGRNLL